MGDIYYVTRAAVFAANAHRSQMRDGGSEPYFNHVARVARLAASTVEHIRHFAYTADVVAAAYLHDVMEDCGVTEDELRLAGFNEKTVSIVRELTDDPSWPRESRKQHQAKKMASASFYARVVKICDQIDNIGSLDALLRAATADGRVDRRTAKRSRRYMSGARMVIDACFDSVGGGSSDGQLYGLKRTYIAAAESLVAALKSHQEEVEPHET